MTWKGVIIEESLKRKDILRLVKIVNTEKKTLENEEEKGRLHFHRIELEDSKKDEFIKKANSSIKQGWYIHVCKGDLMTVIFKNKIFSFKKSQKDKIESARNYGLSVGIIKEQLFSEYLIDNPWV